MFADLLDTIPFIIGASIFMFVIAVLLCCCYINPLICQHIRHRKKIVPIKEEKKEEKSDDDAINPMQIHIHIV